jgi:hypothetical protein
LKITLKIKDPKSWSNFKKSQNSIERMPFFKRFSREQIEAPPHPLTGGKEEPP